MSLVVDRAYPCVVINTKSPEGDMFVVLTDDHSGNLIDVQIHIGKTGSGLAAFTNAVSLLISSNLERGAKVKDLILLLSNITSAGFSLTNNGKIPIRSAIDGVVYALMQYEKDKYSRLYHTNDPRAGREIFNNKDHFAR